MNGKMSHDFDFLNRTIRDVPDAEQPRKSIGKYVAALLIGTLLVYTIPFYVIAGESYPTTTENVTVSGGDAENTSHDVSENAIKKLEYPDQVIFDEGICDFADNDEELKSVFMDLEIQLNTEEEKIIDDNVTLVNQTFEAVFKDSRVIVTGFLPENILCTIEEIENLSAYESMISYYLPDDTLYEIKKAYDINLYLDEKIYEPENHGTFVTVTVEGLESIESSYCIHRIEDDGTITEIESNSEEFFVSSSETEIPSVSFDASHFTIYTIGAETVNTDDLAVVQTWLPADTYGLTCTLYNNGLMVVEGTQNNIFNSNILAAPWYQNEAVKTIYANYNANGITQKYMFSHMYATDFTTGPNFNISNTQSTYAMFYDCCNLVNVDLSKFDTSAVTNMGWMFCNSPSIISLDFSSFNTQNVTDMERMFYGCSSLSSLNVSNFSTTAVTSMKSMFQSCTNLKELNLSNFIGSNVTTTTYMFSDCSSLTSINMCNFSGPIIENLSNMFNNCTALETINISSLVAEKATNVNSMFRNCSALTSLDLSNFKASNATDVYCMFYNCKKLASLNISNFNAQFVTKMGWMFGNCASLKELDLSNFNATSLSSAEYIFYGCTALAILHTPYNNAIELPLNKTFYTHPDNTKYTILPIGTTKSITLYVDTWENGYELTVPTKISLENGKAESQISFVPEKDFEDGASVVITFEPGTKITAGDDVVGLTVNNGTSSIIFTEETTVNITIEAPDIENKKAGSYEGDLNFTITKSSPAT